jgi:tetratricopeptide (TPR) repeat protein
MKCSKCGGESKQDIPELVHQRRNGNFLCPTCLQFKRYETGGSVIKDLIGGILFASIFLLNEKAPWFFLNLYLFFAMAYLSVFPHELGHALGVVLTKCKLLEVSFGQGRQLYSIKLFGVYWEFRIAPIEGYVRSLQQNGCAKRWKDLIIVSMGPAANIFLFLVVWFLFEEMVARESIYKSPAPFFTFALANLVTGIWNLIPFKYRTGHREFVSDGLRILKLIFSKEYAALNKAEQLLLQAHTAFTYKDYHACKKYSEIALQEDNDNVAFLHYYAVSVSGLGNYIEAIDVLNRLLDRPDMEESVRAIVQSNLAYHYLVVDDQSNFNKALQLAENAMQYCSWELSILSNYGGINVVAGDVEKGVDTLTDVRYTMLSKEIQAEVSSLLAIGLAKIGKLDLAKSHLAKARKLDKRCVFLCRAETKVNDAAIELAHQTASSKR